MRDQWYGDNRDLVKWGIGDLDMRGRNTDGNPHPHCDI
jgi:hypothetical protein